MIVPQTPSARIEKIIQNKEITKIEKPGKFEELNKKEFQKKMDIQKLIDRATASKTFKGYLSGYLKVLRKQDKDAVITYDEFVKCLEELFKKLTEYEKIGVSILAVGGSRNGCDCRRYRHGARSER